MKSFVIESYNQGWFVDAETKWGFDIFGYFSFWSYNSRISDIIVAFWSYNSRIFEAIIVVLKIYDNWSQKSG